MERFQNTGQPDWDWWGRLWPTPGEPLRRLGVESGESLGEVAESELLEKVGPLGLVKASWADGAEP
jgi:hypothetical protein